MARVGGRSVIAAAADRFGQNITDRATGIAHKYTRKLGVEHTEILAPEGASAWVRDREELWNCFGEADKRKDAQLARELEIALSVESSDAG